MRVLARIVFIAGAAVLFAYLYKSRPRDLKLVYDLAPPGAPATLEVEIHRGTEVFRRSELSVPPEGGEVEHRVRLPEGEYSLSWRIFGPHPAHGEKSVAVKGDGTMVLPLNP